MQIALIAIVVLVIAVGLMLFMKKKQTAMMKKPSDQPMQQPKPPQQPPQNTPQ